MIKSIFLISLVLFIQGCSFKTPPNQWEHKSATAFSSYTKNFLEGNNTLSRNDLKRAIKHAKKSADLTNLAKIYLGVCALNISVGMSDSCEKYTNIKELVNNKNLDAYYQFLQSTLEQEDIKYLPKAYQEYVNLQVPLLEIKKTTSLLICAALSKETLDSNARQKIIQRASHHGYKKSVIFWLKESLKHDNNPKIQKKINTLTSQ